jgi:hypothetical protein
MMQEPMRESGMLLASLFREQEPIGKDLHECAVRHLLFPLRWKRMWKWYCDGDTNWPLSSYNFSHSIWMVTASQGKVFRVQ